MSYVRWRVASCFVLFMWGVIMKWEWNFKLSLTWGMNLLLSAAECTHASFHSTNKHLH